MFSRLSRLATATAVGAAMMAGTAWAETVIRVQSVIPNSADEVVMLEEFAADVLALTEGEVKIEVLPAGAVVDSYLDRCNGRPALARALSKDGG